MGRRGLAASCVFALTASLSGGCSGGSSDDEGNRPGTGVGNQTGPSSGGSSASGGSLGSGAGAGTTSGGTGGGGEDPVTPSHVVIVAHQDDDLLFINPDLKHIIDAGEPLVVVYVTSGNAGDGMAYVEDRELGIHTAYAHMAGVGNAWTCAAQAYGAKAVRTCTLNAMPEVKTLFFRLIDGFGDGSEGDSVYKLWRGEVTTSSAVDGSGLQFSRQELLDTLVAILETYNARSVRTLDFSFTYGASPEHDHSDHEFTSLFTAVASGAYQHTHQLMSFRTYNTRHEVANLSQNEASLKTEAFEYYTACDSKLAVASCHIPTACSVSTCSADSTLGQFYEWTARQYFMTRSTPPRVTTLAKTSQCLTVSNGSFLLTPCDQSAIQTWTWGADFTLQGDSGQCVTAPATFNHTSDVTLAPCSGTPRQRWFLMETVPGQGKIVLAAAPTSGEQNHYIRSRCLEYSGGLRANPCSEGANQVWSF